MDLYDPVHKKVIGISFIVFSVFSLVAVYFYDVFMEFILEKASEDPDFDMDLVWLFELLDRFIWTLAIVFHVPRLFIGIALTTGQKWARIPGLVFGVISMLNFPMGTALGIYSILVFTSKKRPEETFEKRPY